MLHANQSLKTWGKLKQESSHVYSLIFLIYSSYFLFHMFASGVLFEELGFNYIGQIDGHNINELIEVI